MTAMQQTFNGFVVNAQLVETIAKVLEDWSRSEDVEILLAYRANGLEDGLQEQAAEHIALIEAGLPAIVSVDLSTWALKGRTYKPLYFEDKPNTVEDLAAWVEEKQPENITVKLSVSRPIPVAVTIVGAGSWSGVTVDTENTFGIYGVAGYTSKASPELLFDSMGEALSAFRPVISDHLAKPVSNRVFLGHGQGSDWKILEEKIQAAGFEPQAFESSVAAGSVNIYVIDTAMRASFAAVLYMTPDDNTAEGKKRARQNVVHEVGYAQGVLGIQKVIVVQNDEVEMPSNLDGVTVVRVKTGGLYEKLDEVITYLQKIRSGIGASL